MSADGCNVLMEGRAQTLNYVRSPHRVELTLKVAVLLALLAPVLAYLALSFSAPYTWNEYALVGRRFGPLDCTAAIVLFFSPTRALQLGKH